MYFITIKVDHITFLEQDIYKFLFIEKVTSEPNLLYIRILSVSALISGFDFFIYISFTSGSSLVASILFTGVFFKMTVPMHFLRFPQLNETSKSPGIF